VVRSTASLAGKPDRVLCKSLQVSELRVVWKKEKKSATHRTRKYAHHISKEGSKIYGEIRTGKGEEANWFEEPRVVRKRTSRRWSG